MKTVGLFCACAMALSIAVTLPMQAQQPQSKVPAAAAKKEPPEAARVLSLAGTKPIVIAEPGYYRLDRNWILDDAGSRDGVLQVTADNVTLDFRGYRIETSMENIAIAALGHNFTMRNGTLTSTDDQGYALNMQGGGLIENMSVASNEQASVLGGGTGTGPVVVRDSEFFFGFCCTQPGSVIERNFVYCPFGCGPISDRTRFVDNVIDSQSDIGLTVDGEESVIERNTFGPSSGTVVIVNGRENVIKDNTIKIDGNARPVIQVKNGANILEANVVVPAGSGARATVGIQFTADGNFYGNNRLGALVPVDLGPTTQVDWGGNVGF